MKFSTLIVIFVSAAISGVAATLVAVERDVAELTTDTKNLENLVRAFPTKGGTISQALVCLPPSASLHMLMIMQYEKAIRSATTKVSATFDKATADLNVSLLIYSFFHFLSSNASRRFLDYASLERR